MFSVWPCLSLSVWVQMNLWRCNSTPGRFWNPEQRHKGIKSQREQNQNTSVTQGWKHDKSIFQVSVLCGRRVSPESARAQAQLCGGIRAGTWRWMQESSIRLSACLGRPLPTSARAQGCLWPCLGAFDAGSDANWAGQDDRGSLGWTDPCWRRIHATQMSPHPQTSVGGTGKSRTLKEASETSEYCLNSLETKVKDPTVELQPAPSLPGTVSAGMAGD